MRRSGSGRVARKISAYDDDSSEGTDASQVRRPTFAKNKKRSSLRISFGPGEADVNDGDESSDTPVITPKKANLNRIAVEKNAECRTRSPLVFELPRASIDEDRPTYSKDYISELRNSTPSTPRDLKPTSDEEEGSRTLDIAVKFGRVATLAADAPSIIPTEAEIQEKKARRVRLAKEQRVHEEDGDQLWVSNEDDEFHTNRNEISLRPKEKHVGTRLVRDDEDIAEGFDEFVEDGNISLGQKAKREAEWNRRAEMVELINNAERGSDDDGTDDSDAERTAAYEAAQTRAGAYSEKAKQSDDGARAPPRITPLPDLGEIVGRLEAGIKNKQLQKEMVLKKIEELREDRIQIAKRQKHLQEQLRKTGDEYEKMRQEARIAALPVNGAEGSTVVVDRGLDSLGTTPIGTTPLGSTPMGQRSEDDSDDE